MNWAPEALQAEIDYRYERARTTFEHLPKAERRLPSWWQRRSAHHTHRHDDVGKTAA